VLIGVKATSLDFGAPYEYDQASGLPVSGGAGQAAAPINVAALVHLESGLIGRSFKGRAYQTGVPKDQVAGNTVVSGWAGLLQAAWNELIPTYLAGSDEELVVVSRVEDLSTLLVPVVTPIINCTVSHTIADMGRRLDN